jgi:hypothetical protein
MEEFCPGIGAAYIVKDPEDRDMERLWAGSSEFRGDPEFYWEEGWVGPMLVSDKLPKGTVRTWLSKGQASTD